MFKQTEVIPAYRAQLAVFTSFSTIGQLNINLWKARRENHSLADSYNILSFLSFNTVGQWMLTSLKLKCDT